MKTASLAVAILFAAVALAGGDLPIDKLKVGAQGRLINPSSLAPQTFYIDRIVDEKNMVLRYVWKGSNYLWLSGVSTEGKVDKERITVEVPVKVIGTKRDGRTMFLLAPLVK